MILDHKSSDTHVLSAASIIASRLSKRLPAKRQLQVDIQCYLARLHVLDMELSSNSSIQEGFNISSVTRADSLATAASLLREPSEISFMSDDSGKSKDIAQYHEQKRRLTTERAAIWMEIVSLKDQYRSGTGQSHYHRVAEVSSQEKLSLIDLFNSLSGFTWSKKFGWIGQKGNPQIGRPEVVAFASPASLFEGVDVQTIHDHETHESKHYPTVEGVVNGLHLEGVGCGGCITNCLNNLPHIEHLHLQLNAITGSIPPALTQMKDNLRIIDFSSNLLSGELSVDIFSSLYLLESMNLSCNQFSGAIPNMFEHLSRLQYLNLAGNKFEGSIPDSMGALSGLKQLLLYANKLSGIIPSTFSHLHRLEHLDLSCNQFTGGISPLYHCENLKILNLRNNLFHDEILRDLSRLVNLEMLQLAKNNFHGKFHLEWCNLINLVHLNLSRNDFSGVLPEEIGQLVKLVNLNLKQNRFIGPLPRGLAKLVNLREFKMLATYPSDTVYIPEAFSRRRFERVYGFGPSAGIDNVHWTDDTIAASLSPKDSKG